MQRNKLSTRNMIRMAAISAALGAGSTVVNAATVSKDANTDALNLASSWVGGSAPTSADIATWDATALTGSQSYSLGADLTWSGLKIESTHSGNITIGSGNTLTLGSDGITSNPNVTNTFNNAITLAAAQTWTVTSGTTVFGGTVDTAGHTLHLDGGGTKQFKTTIIGSGNVFVDGSTKFTNGSRATDSDVTVSATLTFDSQVASADRAKSLTLTGGTLSLAANSSSDQVDTITNALTIAPGFSTVIVSAHASRNERLESASLVRQAGGTVLFRGSNLGSTPGAGAANIKFATAPALVGGSGTNTTDGAILVGAYGDSTSGGDGSTATGGLVTYGTDGVRVLTTGEYKSTITNAQTQLDNVLLARTSGGLSQDVNLTADTTINSLSFKLTGAGTDTGIAVSGDPGTKLTVNSGVIYSSQRVTVASLTDATTISVPTLDLNGGEGTIITFANGFSNGNTPGALTINSVITNDGGKGVTFGGSGETLLTGSTANTYTGVTTINSGYLRLNKSVANTGITGDLVINGGALLKNSNAIADTSNVTVNGGSFVMDTTTSSGNNGHKETLNNFTMNGGNFTNHGKDAALTVNGNLTINASQMGMNQGGDITVLGTTSLHGGLLIARESSSTSSANGVTSLNAMDITNTAADPYTATQLNAHATNKGALLKLAGNVTFTGNATNANSVLIDTSDGALANQGIIALDGARTFNIGDGAATVDLAIIPAIVDGDTAGALAKTGAGTLGLNGANTYTGDTTITAGKIALGAGGSIASGLIDINAGAILDSTSQLLTLGAQTLRFTVNGGGAGSAGLLAAGAVDFSAAGIDFTAVGTLDDPAYILATYTSRGGSTFASASNIPANYQLNYNYSGNNVALVLVPEPTSVALIGLFGAGMVGLRRRRA